jgi:hypothetical protein
MGGCKFYVLNFIHFKSLVVMERHNRFGFLRVRRGLEEKNDDKPKKHMGIKMVVISSIEQLTEKKN